MLCFVVLEQNRPAFALLHPFAKKTTCSQYINYLVTDADLRYNTNGMFVVSSPQTGRVWVDERISGCLKVPTKKRVVY